MKVKLLPLMLIVLTTLVCRPESVRWSNGDNKKYGTVSIGFLEDRDVRFHPHQIKNFRNMLSFAFQNRGMVLSYLDYTSLEKKEKMSQRELHPATHSKPVKNKNLNGPMELLPPRLKNVAGEQRVQKEKPPGPEKRFLKPEEIRHLAGSSNFKYFIQGSVGSAQSGNLLDVYEHVLVFLDIYDRTGRKVGTVHLGAQGGSLMDSRFLENVCEKITRIFLQRTNPGKFKGGGPLTLRTLFKY